MHEAFARSYSSFQKSFLRSSIPFVLFIQLGKFLETYDDSARTIHELLGMKLSKKGDNVDSAGFPICSAEKHIRALCLKGYAVIQTVQTEDAETKKQRLENGSYHKNIQRTTIPITTINFVDDRPLCIIQGDSVLLFFSETNAFSVFHAPSNDDIICKLMEFMPCEIILSSTATSVAKTIRHLLPMVVIRQYFEMGFTAKHTLQKYLKIVLRTNLELFERSEVPVAKCHLDARTVLNLTLFGSEHSLVKTLGSEMTKQAKVSLVSMLHNPVADVGAITHQQQRIRTMMQNDYLDILHSSKPKKNTLATLRHALHKDTTKFVFTEKNVRKHLEIIQKTCLEMDLWRVWMGKLQSCMLVDEAKVHAAYYSWDHSTNFTAMILDDRRFTELLADFSQNYLMDCRIASSGMFKHFFESNASNESKVRSIQEATIVSKTKQVIRFDTASLQRERLHAAEQSTRLFTTIAIEIVAWMDQFQEHIQPTVYEQFATIERDLCLAYYFKHFEGSYTFPTFGEPSTELMDLYLPETMTGKNNWVKNNSTEQFIILKGSNGSGKTSFMRSVAINLLLAHCGLPVFASSFRLKDVMDAIRMRFGSNDCLATGKSSFVVEMEHMKLISETMTAHSALFIDELGCSCDAGSGKKICEFFIKMIQEKSGLCVFATHFDLTAGTVKEMGMCDGEYTYAIQDYGRNDSNENVVALAEKCEFPSSVLYQMQSILEVV